MLDYSIPLLTQNLAAVCTGYVSTNPCVSTPHFCLHTSLHTTQTPYGLCFYPTLVGLAHILCFRTSLHAMQTQYGLCFNPTLVGLFHFLCFCTSLHSTLQVKSPTIHFILADHMYILGAPHITRMAILSDIPCTHRGCCGRLYVTGDINLVFRWLSGVPTFARSPEDLPPPLPPFS